MLSSSSIQLRVEDLLSGALSQLTTKLRDEVKWRPPEIRNDDSEAFRLHVMKKIEQEILSIVESLSQDKPPVLSIPSSEWNNITFDNRTVQMKQREECSAREVRWSAPRSRQRMTLLVSTLSRVYRLMASRSTMTRRALFYEQAGVVRSQSALDAAVKDACSLLEAPSWRLGVLTTSKALVSGPLLITTADGQQVDYAMAAGGQLVPQDVVGIRRVRAEKARLILLVEKDTVFQRLLSDDVQELLGPCILITGKGFPDVNTRLLLRRLWDELGLPVLALVDADPYGIEIMCVYRFGSLAMCQEACELVTPAVRWLGVLPSELKPLGVPTQPLTQGDCTKLRALLDRPYVRAEPAIRAQVRQLLADGHKAEIEAVAGLSRDYLSRGYLPSKIRCRHVV